MADDDLPTTVESAVRILRDVIPDEELSAIAAMAETDLVDLHFGFGFWIRNAVGLWKGDSALRRATGERDPDDAAQVIIRALLRTFGGECARLH